VTWRALAATVVVGLVVGGVTFAVGLGTLVILDDTIDTEATAPLSTTEVTFEDVDVPDWKVAGWNFYAAHFLRLEYAFGPEVDVG
jgi:purine nucleoside phosphorylase